MAAQAQAPDGRPLISVLNYASSAPMLSWDQGGLQASVTQINTFYWWPMDVPWPAEARVTLGGRFGIEFLTAEEAFPIIEPTLTPGPPPQTVAQPEPVPVAAPEPPPPPPPRIRVRVYTRPEGEYPTYRPQDRWAITLKVDDIPQDLPPKNILKGFLPPEHQHFLNGKPRRYENTNNAPRVALAQGLPAQVLADAIKAWANFTFTNSVDIESTMGEASDHEEALRLIKLNGATIEVGGMVWRMVPTGVVNARPLIKRVRERALASSKAEAVIIKTRATQDAQTVVRNAETRAATVRAEVERQRSELARSMAQATPPPQWAVDAGRAIRKVIPRAGHGDAYWQVCFHVACLIEDIRYTVPCWADGGTILHWNPIPWEGDRDDIPTIPLWYSLKGGPAAPMSLDYVSADYGMHTVHIAERCCMNLQATPHLISNVHDLNALGSAISRGLTVVNLNSPLDRDWANYWHPFKAQLPLPVRNYLSRTFPIINRDRYPSYDSFLQAHPSLAPNRLETIRAENDATFTVD